MGTENEQRRREKTKTLTLREIKKSYCRRKLDERGRKRWGGAVFIKKRGAETSGGKMGICENMRVQCITLPIFILKDKGFSLWIKENLRLPLVMGLIYEATPL